MDGLLIDNEILYFNIFNDFLNRYGHSMQIEEYTQNCSGNTAITNVEYLVNNYHLPLSVKETHDEKANELPSNCLVLKDSEAGIQAAHFANIPVICIPDLKHPQDSTLKLATCVLQSLDLVIDYINEEVN